MLFSPPVVLSIIVFAGQWDTRQHRRVRVLVVDPHRCLHGSSGTGGPGAWRGHPWARRDVRRTFALKQHTPAAGGHQLQVVHMSKNYLALTRSCCSLACPGTMCAIPIGHVVRTLYAPFGANWDILGHIGRGHLALTYALRCLCIGQVCGHAANDGGLVGAAVRAAPRRLHRCQRYTHACSISAFLSTPSFAFSRFQFIQ